MRPRALVAILVGAVVSLSFLVSSAFIVEEGRQVIITQFGRPVGQPITEAGLHFKLPFLQDVRELDRRILRWDGFPNQIPTKDKKYIIVDTTARWKITDPLKFIQTVQNENGAKSRLDAVLDGICRDIISNHNLVEAVRNTNTILDTIEERKRRPAQDGIVVEEEVIGEIERVQVGREQLSDMIAVRARNELAEFGITTVDVQLRRISYEKNVEQVVFQRMISERQRIAQKIRSVGKGEQAKIQGKVSRDQQQIESDAYRKVQEIKGKAEAEAYGIYAETLGQDPDFYEFVRTLEAYDKSLGAGAHFILSTDSDFLKLFKQGLQKR
ncbi:MAG: protease modulator HflC [Planctomycetes bacterium]|nr:protease modulator HflC [Planctomycetota bacterium]